MATRLAPMRAHDIRFDERLPLYGWQEDVDFSRRLAAHGTVVRLDAATGVHLGTKSGRTAGIRLGYSQVANPIYLTRKRCGYPVKRALEHIAKNMASNVVRSPWPEPFVDRVGRLRGNLLALRDLATGRARPGSSDRCAGDRRSPPAPRSGSVPNGCSNCSWGRQGLPPLTRLGLRPRPLLLSKGFQRPSL